MDGSVVSTLVLEGTRVLAISDWSLRAKVYTILIAPALVVLTTISGSSKPFAQGTSS